MDENQIVKDALDVLRRIMAEYPNDEVGLLAGSMTLAVRPQVFNMKRKSFSDDEQSELLKRARELEAVPTAFFEAATRAVAKRGPAYKTPVFKCLEDFEKCKKHSNRHLCNALMAICVGKQLIPFTK